MLQGMRQNRQFFAPCRAGTASPPSAARSQTAPDKREKHKGEGVPPTPLNLQNEPTKCAKTKDF
jgi:hypothetical protein